MSYRATVIRMASDSKIVGFRSPLWIPGDMGSVARALSEEQSWVRDHLRMGYRYKNSKVITVQPPDIKE